MVRFLPFMSGVQIFSHREHVYADFVGLIPIPVMLLYSFTKSKARFMSCRLDETIATSSIMAADLREPVFEAYPVHFWLMVHKRGDMKSRKIRGDMPSPCFVPLNRGILCVFNWPLMRRVVWVFLNREQMTSPNWPMLI